MFKSLILCQCFVLLTLQSVIAAGINPLEQLSANNIEAVEIQFSTLQAKFNKGEATEYDLLDAYKAFYQREDKFRTQLNAWVDRYPKSSSAYLARGVYFRKLGEFRRGTSYISQVPEDNIAYLNQMLKLAKSDLETSLRLNPRSYLAALHLLNIAQFQSDVRAADRYLALGNSALPSNLLVRARYLIQLTPKWGGSHAQMEKFINDSRQQGLTADKIDLLNAIKSDDQGTVAEELGDHARAREEYKKALLLSRAGGQRFRQDYLGSSARICAESAHSGKGYCQ